MKAWNYISGLTNFSLPNNIQKRLYKFLLRKAIGQFLEKELDLENFDIGLMNGSVELRDLNLNLNVKSYHYFSLFFNTSSNFYMNIFIIDLEQIIKRYTFCIGRRKSGLHSCFYTMDNFMEWRYFSQDSRITLGIKTSKEQA